jgi:hypothetical protein
MAPPRGLHDLVGHTEKQEVEEDFKKFRTLYRSS